jgi:hypothetical protein
MDEQKSALEKNGRGPAMPTLQPTLMKKEEHKGGALAVLLGKFGLGGSAASTGAVAGGGGAAAGGLLATKTGIVALVLAGTSVATGIGMLATSGSSDSQGSRGGVFARAQKSVGGMVATLRGTPQDMTGHNAGSGGGDGVSASLDQFNQANRGAMADPDKVGEVSEADEVADAAGAAEDSGVGVPDNDIALSGGSTKAGARPKLKTGKGFAGRSSASGGGASVASAKMPGAKRPGLGADSNGRAGGLSTSARSSSGARRRSTSANRNKSASGQAASTRNVVRAARANRNASMANAGTTYDGGAGNAGTIGASASTTGDAGYGARATGLQAGKPNPNTVVNTRETPAPAVQGGDSKHKKNKDYTKLLWAAVGLIAAAGIMVMIAGQFKKEGDALAGNPDPVSQASRAKAYTIVKVLSGIAMALGAVAMVIGIKLSGPEYGQKMQGLMIAGLGGITAAMAGMTMYDAFASEKLNTKAAAEKSIWGKMIGSAIS